MTKKEIAAKKREIRAKAKRQLEATQKEIAALEKLENKLSPENIHELIGKVIFDARKNKAISQKELVKKLNIHRSSLSNIEKGRHRVTLEFLLNVFELLDIDAADTIKKIVDFRKNKFAR